MRKVNLSDMFRAYIGMETTSSADSYLIKKEKCFAKIQNIMSVSFVLLVSFTTWCNVALMQASYMIVLQTGANLKDSTRT